MSHVARFVVILAAAGTAVAVATLLTVQERAEFVTLHAEQFALDGALAFSASTIGMAGADATALGTEVAPIEMTDAKPAARTALVANQWTYTVVIAEKTAAALGSGTFKIEVFLNGDAKGFVVVRQQTADDTKIEGVTATFLAGSSLPNSPTFFIRVTEFVPAVDFHEVTLKTTGGAAFYGSSVTDLNPAISFPRAKTLRAQLVNDDGVIHNLAIFQGDARQAPPAIGDTTVQSRGETKTLVWTPPAAGTYEYRCEYHAQNMKGTLTVTAS